MHGLPGWWATTPWDADTPPSPRTRVDALPGEGRVTDAVEALDRGSVEGHAEHAQRAARGDGPVAAVAAVQEAPVRARRAHLPADSSTAPGGRVGEAC